MAHNNDSNSSVWIIFFGGAVAFVFVAWQISMALGVDFSAGGSLLSGLILGAIMIGVGWWQERDSSGVFTVRGMLPLALATVWMSAGPAMQQWGAIGPMFANMTEDTRPLEWWANAYTRWAVALVILGGGYWLVFRERY